MKRLDAKWDRIIGDRVFLTTLILAIVFSAITWMAIDAARLVITVNSEAVQNSKGARRKCLTRRQSQRGDWACDFARRESARPGPFIRRRRLVPNPARLTFNVGQRKDEATRTITRVSMRLRRLACRLVCR
jgi:hypothetical protein